MKNGYECGKCHSTNSIVIDSRWRKDLKNNKIRVRTRECQKCKSRWQTVEVKYWDYIHNKVDERC